MLIDYKKFALVTLMALAMGGGADAQTKTAQAAKGDKGDVPSTLPGGASSLQESYGDWTVVCVEPNGQKRCVLSQAQADEQTKQRVIAVELTASDADSATGVLALPFGLALASGATLQLDDAAPGAPLPFKTCLPVGCMVPLRFDAAALAGLRKGKQLKVHAVAADTGQPLEFSVSLKGFGPAFARTAALAKV